MRQNIASVLLFRRGNKAAFIRRQNTGWYDGYYALPGGKVEPGESFTQAAIREAKEEVGVDITADNLAVVLIAHLRGADDDIWVNVVFEITDWPGELINAEPHMSSELVWLDTDNLPDKQIPNTLFYLEQLAAGKYYGEYGW